MTTTVPAVYAFPEFSGVASAVADHVIAAQNASLKPTKPHAKATAPPNLNRRFKIGLSGGSLISVLEEGLLQRPDVRWDKWDIYFADERLVPFDSPESNYGLVKRKLLDKLPSDVTPPQVFHVDEKLIDNPQEAADDYEKVLIKGFANKDSVKLPMFDLLLLGCAPDGHICSLFPSHPLLREEYAWVAPVEDAPKPPPKRITLTLPVITHSHRVTFVVEGSTKAPVIKTIMERPEKGLPSSLVNEAAAGKVSWFVDDDALTGVYVTKKAYKIQVPSGSEASAATSTANSTTTSAAPSEAASKVSSPVILQVDAIPKKDTPTNNEKIANNTSDSQKDGKSTHEEKEVSINSVVTEIDG